MPEVRLSAVIITYNEEKNIGRCLQSLEGVADDILVVDSFSTDQTEAICRQHGARFLQHPFEGHIQQKNYALRQAAFPCVLSLDADEALSDPLRSSILAAKKNWTCDGYSMNRLTYYCGKWIRHGGWYPDVKLRLVHRDKAHWGGMNPHDRLILEKGATLHHLSGDLLHYSFYTLDQHVEQAHKFSGIAARAKFERGKKAPLWKILFSPLHKFAKMYLFKRGFLDGYEGLQISLVSAYASFLRYAKLRELHARGK